MRFLELLLNIANFIAKFNRLSGRAPCKSGDSWLVLADMKDIAALKHPGVQDLYLVLSDLHMTTGKDPVLGTWSPTEDFFWDEDFAAFLAHYSNGGRATLVINGDTFDFLQVLNVPTLAQAREYRIPGSDISRRYGLRCSEAASVFQIDAIMSGHPVTFRALARFLSEGNQIKIIKGNHDVQLCWTTTQDRIYRRLEELCPRGRKKSIRRNLEFLPWIFYVPGLLYVEHGNQYEAATSFTNFLDPVLPFDSPGGGRHIELDLGSFLIRYFSNRMEVLNPLADNYRPLSRYLKTFFRNHPLVFLSTARDVLRYLTKAVTKAHRMTVGRRSAMYQRIVEKNAQLIREEARRFFGGDRVQEEWLHEQLKEFNARKAAPALAKGADRFLGSLMSDPLKALVWLLPLYSLTYIPDFSRWIEAELIGGMTGWGRMFIETLFVFRIPQAFLGLLLLLAAFDIRVVQRGRTRRQTSVADPAQRLRVEAAYIAARLKIPYVLFGHTHVEDTQMLPGGSVYFNTGTWIGVFSEQENLYRNVRQFTFAKFEDGRGELLYWDPERGRPQPVVVVDAKPYLSRSRARWFATLWNLLRRR
jgi:UDP-2,3-diacylglucosamine pyrophosphatase LpxH